MLGYSPYRTAAALPPEDPYKPSWLHRCLCRFNFHDWRVIQVRHQILQNSSGHLIDPGRFLDDLCLVECRDCGRLLKGAGQSSIALDWSVILYLNLIEQAEELHKIYSHEVRMGLTKDFIRTHFLKQE